MSLPFIAVVGRPNVGKSTFVNRIAQNSEAIVHETRGVTRDRSYHEADWNGVKFTLVDTGGIEIDTPDSLQSAIRSQALASVDQADSIIFLVDGKSGIDPDDEAIAKILKKSDRPVYLVVNKLDNESCVDGLWEFLRLGLGDPWPISASHGHGTGDLLDEIVRHLTSVIPQKQTDDEKDLPITVAIIGRPNAGKSSLANKMVKSDRSIVSGTAGTTCDAIDTLITHEGQDYKIIDTAGLRKRSRIVHDVEYYSYIRAMRAIDRCEVAVLVIDATIGLTDQDQRVAAHAAKRHCALVIALNKWDRISTPEEKISIRERLNDRLTFVRYAPIVSISALTGKNIFQLWEALNKAYSSFTLTIATSKLNAWLGDIRESGHSISKGKAILRMKYVTQTSTCPPCFTFFVNRPDLVNENYRRFLENRLRKYFDLSGTPVQLRFKRKD